MSWIRTAVSKAVEVGGRNPLTRVVRDYADTVVHHAGYAVLEGARFLQGNRNVQSFKQTVKRLEELSVSCRGVERVQLLRRWLVALKEIERISAYAAERDCTSDSPDPDESRDSPRRPTLVCYYDSDLGGEPRNFRDVFLHSQALEGITLSMILESPSEEEVSLLIELYRLCLKGGAEVENRVANSIQDLAKAFTNYQEEVLVKREELLQYAQGAIAGLKLNADLARIDAETFSLKEKLNKINAPQQLPSGGHEKPSKESGLSSVEALEAEQAKIQLCSMMELLLLRKKALKDGDSLEVHTEKVHKLKILSESLASSSSKAEKRVSDHRHQKEEALNFRMAKTNEINQAEKELVAEMEGLEKQKKELEAALKKVNSSLAAARQRLQYAKEEREQFDEASNQILVHFKSKEDELSRSILSCRVEADVVNTWISFLEGIWILQTSCLEQNEKQVSNELEKHGEYFVNLVIELLSFYEVLNLLSLLLFSSVYTSIFIVINISICLIARFA
ncbi:uncharacterized protein LOC116207280 isoform X1 [Punica granatum]|uniref:Uncharacterized protein LOC116207280 isoform X1 n=1 Tax=Punica granatum TaxID=22663 RepID=A0A6P8DNP1_PUNGR|nr:uncharacterized protein LOC116207280 isoform X1 [Punica granatum]